MAGKDLEKFIERYPTYIEALEMLEDKDQRIAELEQELAKYKELQDRLGLKNADEFEWFVMLDLLTDNEKNMHILDLHRELAELKEKAIFPKFKLGQKVFTINKPNECIFELKIVAIRVTKHIEDKFNILVYDTERVKDKLIMGHFEEGLFATKQEAQEKLKEMQND